MKAVFSSIFILHLSMLLAQNGFIRTFGVEGTFNDGKGVTALPDTTYMLCGNRISPGGESSAWIFRVNSTGNIMWELYLDQFDLSSCLSMSKHDDTSVVVCGTRLLGGDYAAFATRIGKSGKVIWIREINSPAWDVATCSASDFTGSVWVTGYALGYDTLDQDLFVYRLDGSSGDSLLYKRIDNGYDDKGMYIDTASGHSLILASQSFAASNDSVLSQIWRLDFNLDTLWTFRPEKDSVEFYVEGVMQDTLERIVYYGYALPDTTTLTRGWYGARENNGQYSWDTFIHPDYFRTIFRSLTDSLNRFILTGNTSQYWWGNSDIGSWHDSAGYVNFWYYGALQQDESADLDFSADGGMVYIGSTKSYGPGVTNIFLVKVGADQSYQTSDYAHFTPVQETPATRAILFPNPSRGELVIRFPGADLCKLQIYSINGSILYQGDYFQGSVFDASFLANGMYMIRISNGNDICHFRLILQKN